MALIIRQVALAWRRLLNLAQLLVSVDLEFAQGASVCKQMERNAMGMGYIVHLEFAVHLINTILHA
jgi:hypothetical protein